MWNIVIVSGFAFMLFLPCAVALYSGRERKDELDSAYSDRLINVIEKPLAAPAEELVLRMSAGQADEDLAMAMMVDEWNGLSDSNLLMHSTQSSQDRVELAELEALRARAVAARAHAEALAAIARAAAAKAEAAAANAELMEDTAAHAVQDIQHAA